MEQKEVIIAKPRGKRFQKPEEKDLTRINEQIRTSEVRVIDEEGEQLGILPIQEAISTAAERGLDLVEVGATSKPPVCRIMDYGKFKYQASKRQHEAKKKQTKIVIKEIKLRPKTEEHDFNFKVKHAKQFLGDGNKVKVTLMYRGREMAHRDLGIDVLNRFAEALVEEGAMEQQPRAEGRTAMMVLAPKKSK